MKKRLFALLLAVVMILGMGMTAFGEAETPEDTAAPEATETPEVSEEPEATEEPDDTATMLGMGGVDIPVPAELDQVTLTFSNPDAVKEVAYDDSGVRKTVSPADGGYVIPGADGGNLPTVYVTLQDGYAVKVGIDDQSEGTDTISGWLEEENGSVWTLTIIDNGDSKVDVTVVDLHVTLTFTIPEAVLAVTDSSDVPATKLTDGSWQVLKDPMTYSIPEIHVKLEYGYGGVGNDEYYFTPPAEEGDPGLLGISDKECSSLEIELRRLAFKVKVTDEAEEQDLWDKITILGQDNKPLERDTEVIYGWSHQQVALDFTLQEDCTILGEEWSEAYEEDDGDGNTKLILADQDQDGFVTVKLKEEKYITVILDAPAEAQFQLFLDGEPLEGDRVYYVGEPYDIWLSSSVARGYSIVKSAECLVDSLGELRLSDYDGDEKVTIKVVPDTSMQVNLAGEVDKLHSLTLGDVPVEDGDTVYLSDELTAVFETGYCFSDDEYERQYEAEYDAGTDTWCVSLAPFNSTTSRVTFTVGPRPSAKLTIEDPEGKLKSMTGERGEEVTDGSQVYTDVAFYDFEMEPGYLLQCEEADIYEFSQIRFIDVDEDGQITLTVVPAAKVTFVDDDEVVELFDFGGEGIYIVPGDENSYVSFSAPQNYTVTVENGRVLSHTHHVYWVNEPDGSYSKADPICDYEVMALEPGETVITVTDAGSSHVQYGQIVLAGDEDAFMVKIDPKDIDFFKGEWCYFVVTLKNGYTLTVDGGVIEDNSMTEGGDGRYYDVSVPEGVDTVTLTATKNATGVTLEVNGGVNADALVADSPCNTSTMGPMEGRSFILPGEKFDGEADILVKNGYKVKAVSGGSCVYYGTAYQFDEINGEITGDEMYTFYHITAPDDGTDGEKKMVISVEPCRPMMWARLRAYLTRANFTFGNAISSDLEMISDDYYILPSDWYVVLGKGFTLVPENARITGVGEGTVDANTIYLEPGAPSSDGVVYISLRAVPGKVQLEADVQAVGAGTQVQSGTVVPGASDKQAAEQAVLGTMSDIVASVQDESLNEPTGVTMQQAQQIKAAADAGGTITTSLNATPIAQASATDEAVVAGAVSTGGKVENYVDMSISVKAAVTDENGQESVTDVGAITQTTTPIQLAIAIPEDMAASDSIFSVVRVHDGAAQVLPTTREGNVLYFQSNLFSTFAVVSYPADLALADVEDIPDQVLDANGKAEPKPVVKVNGVILTEGEDYELRYEKNTALGTASVTITAKQGGIYEGSQTVEFKIVCNEHDWDDGTVTKTPTCTAEGVMTYKCKNHGCTAERTETINRLPHEQDDGMETKAPTCTEKGVRTYKCKVCGTAIKTETIAAKGHKWGDKFSFDWAEDGKSADLVQVCDNDATHTQKVEVTVTVTEKENSRKEPTCGAAGEVTYTATAKYDNETYTENKAVTLPATGKHTWDEGKVTKEPTASAKGEKTFTCTVCGQTKAEAVPALGGGSGSGSGGDGSGAPQTGDETPLALWTGMMALCLGGLALVLTLARRKRAK